MVKTLPSIAGGVGSILVRELRSHMPRGQKTKTQNRSKDFPGGTVVKNPPANAGDTGSSPGPERSHMSRSN